MSGKYNIWNKWDKLKTVMLGDNYRSEFFRDIKNNRIRSGLQRIADETQEDLEYYEKVLKDFGCTVLRPELDHNDNIMNYIDADGKITDIGSGPVGLQGVPRSPLQVRDTQLVAGNTLYYTGYDHYSVKNCLDKYSPDCVESLALLDPIKDHPVMSEDQFNFHKGADWLSYADYIEDDYYQKIPDFVKNEIYRISHHRLNAFQAPSITVVGKDIYIDTHDLLNQNDKSLAESVFKDKFRLNYLSHGGHSDGCFHTIKPGAILSIEEIQKYENTFPGWDICYLPGQSWGKVQDFMKLKKQTGGKWWVPGEEDNDELTHFVETWLQDWVGYVEETVFDVNVLVLDDHHVCVNNMNPQVIEFLKKHKMEPVHVPWRHRYFWDGGLHCITLDLEREGTQEDYFPERGTAGVIDYGFD